MSRFRRELTKTFSVMACGTLLFVGACNTKKQEAAPPPPSGIPPLDQPAGAAAPAAGDRPVHSPVAGAPENGTLPPGHPALPPDHPSTMGGAAPSGAFAGATPGGQFDPKTVLAGVIKVDNKIKDKVAPGDIVFVVARRYEEGATGPGTALAVQKLTVDKFPLKFSLDSRDAMMAGTTLSGKVVVTVRVDKDGDAISKNPGDVIGQSKPVEPPKKDLVVSLDTVL